MANDMPFHRNWKPSGFSRMIRAVFTTLATLFCLTLAGVWLVQLPDSVQLLAKAYKQAVSSGRASDKREPEKKLRCFRHDSFITGSTARECEPK